MLIEPDAHARYVAATLAVVNCELRKVAVPAGTLRTIFGLLERAQDRAEHLADALCVPDTMCAPPRLPRPARASSASNVLPFARRA